MRHHVLKSKDVLTTGQVAKICSVAPRTVSKWFDGGQLQGYRIPGSRDRRIPVDQLVRFMKTYGMPLNGLEVGPTRVLVLDECSLALRGQMPEDEGYEVRVAASPFEAGVAVEKWKPDVMVLATVSQHVDARGICRDMRSIPGCEGVKLIAACEDLSTGCDEEMRQLGFDAAMPHPFALPELIQAADEVLGLSD